MVIVHLVARLRRPRRDLNRFDVAAWLWERLDAHFPATIARAIMPNHPHVLAGVDDATEAAHRLARICGQLQRRLGVPNLFEPVPPAEVVEPEKVSRAARYIELNPCRSGYVLHPAEWLWTSLRDVIGASMPSVDQGLHRRLTRSSRDAWLDYVTHDDRVPDRRSLVEPVLPRRSIPAFGLESVAAAVVAATRRPPTDIRARGPVRDLFFAAAMDQGVTDTGLIARICRCSPRAVQAARHRDPPTGLSAVRQCLADPRLLVPTAAITRQIFRDLERRDAA